MFQSSDIGGPSTVNQGLVKKFLRPTNHVFCASPVTDTFAHRRPCWICSALLLRRLLWTEPFDIVLKFRQLPLSDQSESEEIVCHLVARRQNMTPLVLQTRQTPAQRFYFRLYAVATACRLERQWMRIVGISRNMQKKIRINVSCATRCILLIPFISSG